MWKNRRMSNGRPIAITATACILVLVGVAAYHGYAITVEQRARDRSLRAVLRLDDARRAAELEPFNHGFQVTAVIVQAEAMHDLGASLRAYDLMHPIVENAVTDPYFKAVYHDVNQARIRASARKAHVQHGREKAGGVIDDQDYFP